MVDIQTAKIRLATTILNTNDVTVIEAVDKALQQVEQTEDLEVVGLKSNGTPTPQQDLKNSNADKSRKEYLFKKLSGAWEDDPVLSSDELEEEIYNSRSISDKNLFEE